MSYQASKWLKIHVLLTPQELLSLAGFCSPFEHFPLGRVLAVEELPGSIKNFSDLYREALAGAVSPHLLAAAWTLEPEALQVRELSHNGRALVQILLPVLQIRAHFIRHSEADGSIRSMAWGPDARFWGLEFSYPQIYQDQTDGEILSALQRPNAQLFKRLRQWIRDETEPTLFCVAGQKIVSPVRIGKLAKGEPFVQEYLWR